MANKYDEHYVGFLEQQLYQAEHSIRKAFLMGSFWGGMAVAMLTRWVIPFFNLNQ